jgi:hypothetical protein
VSAVIRVAVALDPAGTWSMGDSLETFSRLGVERKIGDEGRVDDEQWQNSLGVRRVTSRDPTESAGRQCQTDASRGEMGVICHVAVKLSATFAF